MTFDSKEEEDLYNYFLELKERGYLVDIICQPDPFILTDAVKGTRVKTLKTKEKKEEFNIQQPSIYTCDFKLHWSDKAKDILFEPKNNVRYSAPYIVCEGDFDGENYYTYVECKPEYDMQNMTRLVIRTIKHVYSLYKVNVHINKPNSLFKKTFAPIFFVKRKRVIKFPIIDVDTYLESRIEHVKKIKEKEVALTEYLLRKKK